MSHDLQVFEQTLSYCDTSLMCSVYFCTDAFICPVVFVSVHISADPRRHPGDCGSLPVPPPPACGRIPQGECRRLPRQPGRPLEPGHRHRASPQNGTRHLIVSVNILFYFFIYTELAARLTSDLICYISFLISSLRSLNTSSAAVEGAALDHHIALH